MKKTLFFIQLICSLLFVSGLRAADPTPTLSNTYCQFYPSGEPGTPVGNVTINNNCAVYGDVDGVINGNLTIAPNIAITLHKELVFSPGYQINIQKGATAADTGIVYVNTGGSIIKGNICVKDADHDGYAETKTLTTDPYGVPLASPITQIDQVAVNASTSCPTDYFPRSAFTNLALVDTNPSVASSSDLATSDREMLRLGFQINGVSDVQAGTGDIQIIDKNLLVCTGGTCPATSYTSPTTGNIYTAGKIGVGITNPGYNLEVNGTSRINGNFTIGDASTDTTTITGTAITTPNGLIFDANTLVLDAANNRIGIGKTNPAYPLDVTGDANVSGTLNVGGNANICNLVAYTSGSGTVQCPIGFYTYTGTGLTTGYLLCCKVSNPI